MVWLKKLGILGKKFFSKISSNFSHDLDKNRSETSNKSIISPEQRRSIFLEFITQRVAEGYSIEINNEFDAVLSKKTKFSWFGKLILPTESIHVSLHFSKESFQC